MLHLKKKKNTELIISQICHWEGVRGQWPDHRDLDEWPRHGGHEHLLQVEFSECWPGDQGGDCYNINILTAQTNWYLEIWDKQTGAGDEDWFLSLWTLRLLNERHLGWCNDSFIKTDLHVCYEAHCSGGLGDYATIHVTPEVAFSYVSFETNRLVDNYMELIKQVVNTFKPGKLMVTFYATRVGLSVLSDLFNVETLIRRPRPSASMKNWKTQTKSMNSVGTTFSFVASRQEFFVFAVV